MSEPARVAHLQPFNYLGSSQCCAQGRQSAVPLPTDIRHPRHRVIQRRRRDAVAHIAPRTLTFEQARLGERTEMPDDRLAGDRQLDSELCRGRGLDCDCAQELPPRGVGKRSEHRAG